MDFSRVLLPRQNDDFDGTTTTVPEGFVVEDGQYVPFWYSRVSDFVYFLRGLDGVCWHSLLTDKNQPS